MFKPDAGIRPAHQILRVDVAQEGELQQVMRTAIDVRPGIQHQQVSAAGGGQERTDGGPVHPGEALEHEHGSRHHRTRGPRADESLHPAPSVKPDARDDGRTGLAAHHGGGWFVRRYALGSVHDLQSTGIGGALPVEFRLDLLAVSHQHDRQIGGSVVQGIQRSGDFGRGGGVAPHGVECDSHRRAAADIAVSRTLLR